MSVFVHDARENVRLSQALRPIQAKKADIFSISAARNARQTEADKITEDQKRLRENMAALKGSSGEKELLKRYVTQLNQQQDRIAGLRRETADLEQKLSVAQTAH